MGQDKRVKELLEKYWSAETTEEEEAELKAYFTNPDADGDPAMTALFGYFRHEKNVAVGEGFDERFDALVHNKPATIKWINPLWKVAAAVLIIIGVTFLFKRSSEPTNVIAYSEKDTYNDPEKAYQETKKALMLISHNLSTGSNYVAEIKKINEAEKIINSTGNKK